MKGSPEQGKFINYLYMQMILYMSNPITSLPVVLDILDKFGSYSGSKLNLHKSELLPINSLAKNIPQLFFPFKYAREGLKYLGVQITGSFNQLYSRNFSPLLERCKLDFDRWSGLPLSLMGRASLVKMIV